MNKEYEYVRLNLAYTKKKLVGIYIFYTTIQGASPGNPHFFAQKYPYTPMFK